MKLVKKRIKQMEQLVKSKEADRLNEKEEAEYFSDCRQSIEAYLNNEKSAIDFSRYYRSDGQCKYKLPHDFFSQYSTEELRKIAKSNL